MHEPPAPPSRLARHLGSARESLARLLRKPVASFLTISVMALALSLPLGLWLTLGNLERLSGPVERSRAIEVFLSPDTTPEHARALAGQLRAWDDVAGVEHQTPEQGMTELNAQGLNGVSELLRGENPLPHLLRVFPRGDDGALIAALEALPEVDLIQHDTRWRRQVDGWLRLGNRLLWLLGSLFGIGCALVVANTVRLDFQSRREEMGVLQLLGAGDDVIRQPFVWLGLWYGLLGGLLALALLFAARVLLSEPLVALVSAGDSGFVLHGFAIRQTWLVLISSTALGGVVARLVSGRLLRRIGGR